MFLDVGPLRHNTAFRRLFASQFISGLGTMVSYVAVPWQLYELTRSNALVGLLGGAVADRVDRKRLLIASEALMALCLLGLLANALQAAPSVLAIYGLVAVLQASSGFHRPALEALTTASLNPLAPRPAHFGGRAKSVIWLFMTGAPSQVDTWDYKPELFKRHNTPMPGSGNLITFQGEQGNLIKPIRDFKPRGQSGKMISDLLPNLAEMADDMCFIHSMTAKSNTHGPAENQMGTGYILDGFPSAGAWVTYALGSENQNFPAFVADRKSTRLNSSHT